MNFLMFSILSVQVAEDNSDEFYSFMQHLQAGDAQTWKKLYFVLQRAVSYWLHSKGISPTEVKEVCHDTCTKFYERFPDCEFSSYKKMKSYAIAIADNKLKEKYRRDQQNQQQLNVDDLPLTQQTDEIIQAENELLIQALCKSLTDREREVLFAYYYRCEKLKNIAHTLGTTFANCRIIKHRSLLKLRQLAAEMLK